MIFCVGLCPADLMWNTRHFRCASRLSLSATALSFWGHTKKMANLLSLALFAGVAYFVAMSVAHFVGFKIPVLFIFYDVPSNAYQDKIISFCAFV